jgi:hypothetical protein
MPGVTATETSLPRNSDSSAAAGPNILGLPSRRVNANGPLSVRPEMDSVSRHEVSANVSHRNRNEQHSNEYRGLPMKTTPAHPAILSAPVQALLVLTGAGNFPRTRPTCKRRWYSGSFAE